MDEPLHLFGRQREGSIGLLDSLSGLPILDEGKYILGLYPFGNEFVDSRIA